MTNTITVTTDTKDYAPGEWVEISASGVQAGGTLEFQVQHVSSPGDDAVWGTFDDVVLDLGGAGHDAWSITDGGDGDLDGMVNGAIVTSWYVNPDDSLDQTFLLTARMAGQLLASASFTDAAGSTNKVYQHWADGDAAVSSTPEWNNNILNANKSDYFEGEVIPHVFIYKATNSAPLVNGQTYSFNITYNYYQQNTDALGFDYLTTYNASRSPGALGVTSPYIVPSLDSTFTNNGGFTSFGSVTQGFYTVDANITNVSQVTATGSGTLDHHLTITFTYTGATTTNGVAEVYYGLHIAGPTNTEVGASAWSGGSLQTTVDIGGSGATSIQLAPAAIIAGTISGYKFEDVNGNGSWDSGEQSLSGWTIYLDANGNNQLDTGEVSDTTDSTGQYSFSVTPDANKATVVNDGYVVREVQQTGWSQTTANPAPIVITSVDPTEANVNFGNQRQLASMTIEKIFDGVTGGDGDELADAVGDVLNYTVTVTNTGNVTLTGVTVQDPLTGQDISGVTLAAGESKTYATSYVLTQADLDYGGNAGADGDIDNTAKADSNQTDEISDSVSVDLLQSKALHLEKTAAVPGGTADTVGETITYTYEVSNTGNAAIANVTVDDDNATPGDTSDDFSAAYVSGDTDNDSLLDVDETWTYSSTRDVTQDMLDDGSDLTNVATASGDDATSDDDDATVQMNQSKALHLEKTAAVPGGTADTVGETITYTYEVSNTGNAAIANVTVEDDNATSGDTSDDFNPVYVSGDSDNDSLLDVDETWTYSSTRDVTQDMLDDGSDLTNVATASGDDATSDDDDATVQMEQSKSLHLEKTAAVPGGTADAVGETITYTYEVSNTGNAAIANVTVEDDNATSGDTSDDFNPVYVSGDSDNDSLLDVDETWTYSSTRDVTQDMLDDGSDLTNVATASGDDATSDDDDATVGMEQKPAISLNKVTVFGTTSGDGLTGMHSGDQISWKYTVKNLGNTALSDVQVKDDNGTSGTTADDFTLTHSSGYVSGDTDADGKLDVDETWIFEKTGTAVLGSYQNTGTASGTAGDTTVHDDDTSSYTSIPRGALVAPTGTTPQQYISGTAMTFEDYYAYQNGDIQYSVKSGKINQTNPGVFFYFTGLSGAIKGVDGADADTKADSMTVTIDQTRDIMMTTPFLTAKSGVVLYKVISSDNVIDASDSLVAVKPTSISTANADGDFSITFTPDAVGSMYVMAIKYSTVASFVGGTITNPSLWPTVNYHFDTRIGSNIIESGYGGVDLAPKPASLMLLAGDAGAGAPAIHNAQVHTAFKAALAWWDKQGYDVAELKHQSVQIADLGDSDEGWILGMTSAGQITIDDDAAGHGWSIGMGRVAPNKVDLFSVLVHELGHELGLSDDQMGDFLDVGTRMLPQLEEGDSTTALPLPAALFGLVGTQPTQESNHFG